MDLELTLYSRAGCHLCEDMETLLPEVLEEFSNKGLTQAPTDFSIVYINNHPDLESIYGTRVPVLKAGEEEICHYFLDVKALQQYISEAGNPLK